MQKNDYKIITIGENNKIFQEFGLKSIILKSNYDGKNNIIGKLLLAKEVIKNISEIYNQGDQVIFMYGDMFDWFIKIMLQKKIISKIPKNNISSININQKSKFKLIKNIYTPKVNLLNYYENLYEYLQIDNKNIIYKVKEIIINIHMLFVQIFSLCTWPVH